MSSAELRNRKPAPASSTAPPNEKDEEETSGKFLGPVDVLRVLSGILLLSAAFSWFVTDGESFLWGYKPAVARWRTWKNLFTPELSLTPEQLSLYNGTDPTIPLYVAVNGSVYDVSANRAVYGPGGSYNFFAGRDATRAYVSGCFKDDLTYDIRGLEAMFVVGKEKEQDEAQLAEINQLEALKREGKLRMGVAAHGEGGEGVEEELEEAKGEGRLRYLKGRREKRWREARERVDKGIRHWQGFFAGHEKYFYVGKVQNPPLEGTPVRELCKKGKGKPKT